MNYKNYTQYIIDRYKNCPVCKLGLICSNQEHKLENGEVWNCENYFCKDKNHSKNFGIIINKSREEIGINILILNLNINITNIIDNKGIDFLIYKYAKDNFTDLLYYKKTNNIDLIDWFICNINDEEKIKDKINTILLLK